MHPPARTGGGLEVDRVQHGAAVSILQVHLDRIADADAQHRTWHLAVESPLAECRSFRESRLKLYGDEIDPHRLRSPVADRRRNVRRFLRDVGFNHGLRHR